MSREKENSGCTVLFEQKTNTNQVEVNMQPGLTITDGIALPVWIGAA
jgi:hypothetical protein